MMREAVAHIAQTALLNILFDGIERLLLGDLHLGVSPARNFDDHVQDSVVLVCEKGDVVKGGHDSAILFDVDSMFYINLSESI
jgi:hypothetical protein